MKLNKRFASILLLVGLLVGGLVAGITLAGKPAAASAQSTDACAQDDDSQEVAETEDLDNVQEEVECGGQDGNEADEASEADEANEADEAASGEQDEQDAVIPADWTGLTLDEAKAIAESANSGAAVLDAEFEQEGGSATYEVELDNGVDVTIDALTGDIIRTETE